ncbi:MAG: hypothetical protein JRH08_11880 [Deltaproteobacteria bacterium]|nr:hypothetical protein [Deltaproteobacteria bacterium]MBW1931045.1 hypothetical protein [Deltaproteobacteria bacterium]MBW2026387.1 hypothetical protein [Deltaproteobacteria bacterium]MBW2126371.1 hypothetical protein [Deltaproteobacteria bacterium]
MFLFLRSPLATGHSLCLFEAVLHDWNECAFDQLVDKLWWGVIGASGFSFSAIGEFKSEYTTFLPEHGSKIQQTLINTSQLFHIQGSIVDAAPWDAFTFPIHGKVPDRSQEVAVLQDKILKITGPCGIKKITIQRRNTEHRSSSFILKDSKCGP